MRTDKERLVITVYEESTQLKSHQGPNDRIRRLLNSSCTTTTTTTSSGIFRARGCYDRRAQLLAYAKELRNAAATSAGQEFSRPRQKGQKWCGGLGSVQKRMKVWLNGMNRWEYVPIDTQDYYRDDEHIRKGSGKPTTTFCKRVRCWLKEMSMALRICRNGDCCC